MMLPDAGQFCTYKVRPHRPAVKPVLGFQNLHPVLELAWKAGDFKSKNVLAQTKELLGGPVSVSCGHHFGVYALQFAIHVFWEIPIFWSPRRFQEHLLLAPF